MAFPYNNPMFGQTNKLDVTKDSLLPKLIGLRLLLNLL